MNPTKTALTTLAALSFAMLPACSITSREPEGASSAHLDDVDGGSEASTGHPAAVAAGLTWPNEHSRANSDPWLVQNHDAIRSMHPRVLVLNFSNHADALPRLTASVTSIIAGLADGSRYHGYTDASAPSFLSYEVAKIVDLADLAPEAIGWTHRTSSHYPLKCSTTSWYQFDYAALLGDEFTRLIDIHDPNDDTRLLPLAELVDTGRVHEVWINVDGDPDPLDCANGLHMNDFQMPESIELKPKYDADGQRIAGSDEPCAGNGCMDDSDRPAYRALGRSLRMVYLNETRGPGCAVHSLGHSFESMANTESVAYLAQRGKFRHFGNFDLAERHGVPFRSWYEQCSTPDCLTYDGTNAVAYQSPERSGRLDDIDQGCGNVHFAPNSRGGYDVGNAQPVLSTCEHFGMGDAADGNDLATPYTRDSKAAFDATLPDCGGGWQVYWRQSFPGLDNAAHDATGAPMKNWWPFLFY